MSDPRPAPAPRPPAGLLGMLALVLAVEAFVARHDLDFMRYEAWDWRMTWRAAARQAPGCEVLCFGDSLMKFGVLPRVLEGRLGVRSHNLAICSGAAPTSYFLFRRALERGARPRLVVVDFMRKILADPPQSRTVAFPWAELLTTRDGLDLAWTARDPAFFAETMLARALPSLRVRHEVRANVLGALRGESTSLRPFTPMFLRTWAFNHGAQPTPPHPQFPFRDESPDPGLPLAPDPWACDPINAEYCRRFFALAAAHRIPVYWLLPPISPGERARCARLGPDEPYLRFVREMQARCPNVVVLDGRRSEYVAAVFIDRNHLNPCGALLLSDDLATTLARPPGAAPPGRWVDLPAFHIRPVEFPMEDLDQSRVALDAARARSMVR